MPWRAIALDVDPRCMLRSRLGPDYGKSTIRYNGIVGSKDTAAGALLRQARQRAGLTQAELAEKAGVTQSVISAYESGQRQPSLAGLAALVGATGFELSTAVRR